MLFQHHLLRSAILILVFSLSISLTFSGKLFASIVSGALNMTVVYPIDTVLHLVYSDLESNFKGTFLAVASQLWSKVCVLVLACTYRYALIC